MKKVRERLVRILRSWIGAIVIFISLFFFHTPYELTLFPAVSVLLQFMPQVLIVLLFICLILLHKNPKEFFRQEILLWLVILWDILYCVCCEVNAVSLQRIPGEILVYPLGMVLLISVFSKVDTKRFLFCLFMYYLVMNTANNASVFFFHNYGMWRGSFQTRISYYTFVGHMNNALEVALPSMLAGILYARQYDKQWMKVNVINLIFSIASVIVIDCVIAVAVYAVIFAAVILILIYDRKPGIRKGLRWVSAGSFLVFDLLLFDAVVLLEETGWMEWLHLDPTVHGRRGIWDTAVNSIIDHPWIGKGYFTKIEGITAAGSVYTQTHAHSFYLQFPYETGLLGLVLFIAMLFVCVYAIRKAKSFDIRFVLGVLFGSLCLLYTIEVSRRVLLFLALAVFYYYPKYLPESKHDPLYPFHPLSFQTSKHESG